VKRLVEKKTPRFAKSPPGATRKGRGGGSCVVFKIVNRTPKGERTGGARAKGNGPRNSKVSNKGRAVSLPWRLRGTQTHGQILGLSSGDQLIGKKKE